MKGIHILIISIFLILLVTMSADLSYGAGKVGGSPKEPITLEENKIIEPLPRTTSSHSFDNPQKVELNLPKDFEVFRTRANDRTFGMSEDAKVFTDFVMSKGGLDFVKKAPNEMSSFIAKEKTEDYDQNLHTFLEQFLIAKFILILPVHFMFS